MLTILQFKHLMFPRLWIRYGFMRFCKTLHSFLFTFYKKKISILGGFYCVSKYLSVIFLLEHLRPCKPLSGIMKSAGTGSGAATLPPVICSITNKGNKYTTESYYMTVPLFCKQHCIWPLYDVWFFIPHSSVAIWIDYKHFWFTSWGWTISYTVHFFCCVTKHCDITVV